ncbi:MAG: ribonuclease P protein component [Candidatus Aphodosoma sp.]
MQDLTLPKAKHLCSETAIARLYAVGRAFIVFPIRVVYRTGQRATAEDATHTDCEPRPTVRVLFSVPKKRFRHAVDRNRYRRLMREAYRHHQSALVDELDRNNMVLDISFMAVHNVMPTYRDTEKSMVRIIEKLTDPEKGIMKSVTSKLPEE